MGSPYDMYEENHQFSQTFGWQTSKVLPLGKPTWQWGVTTMDL